MEVTWVLMLALGVVTADVSHLGYHYKVPHTSYGIPSYQSSGSGSSGIYSAANTGAYNTGSSSLYSPASTGQYNSGSYSTGQYQNAAQTGSIGSGYTGYQTGGAQSSGLGSGYYQQTTAHPTYQYTGFNNLGTQYQTEYQSSSQYQGSSNENYRHYYTVNQQPTQVFKHFYVHAAPEEPEPPKVRTPIVLPPAQKHYKIIFVKTPTESRSTQVIAPVAPQTEEKTIVYVLVKKPEDQQEVILPKVEQKPPSKPEVYFIKYKNKEDSQAVINNIVQDYNKGQEPVSFVNAGTGESSYTSGLNNVQYNTPAVQTQASSGSFGSQSYSVSGSPGTQSINTASAGLSGDLNDFVSSTASSVDYESATGISTSQGVPHQTYGPPKFRNY